jgi:hypothetical protein
MFQSGVRAVLQGPATLEVSSKMGAFLSRGRLTVTVLDPDARGFAVHAPGMKYTDLGTEFGVFVRKDGSQEMHVFRGKVQAEAEGQAGVSLPEHGANLEASAPVAPLILFAHQAIRVAAAGSGKPERPFEQFSANEKRFSRMPIELVPFALFGTGIGMGGTKLKKGESDPHWEIVNISTAPTFSPQPAVVAETLPFYLNVDQAAAQWISVSRALKAMPGGCRWTYRTHFDLTGFDASTARIEGRIAADDFLGEMRLNGNSVPLSASDRGVTLLSHWHAWKIENGFAAGDNTLEIVVENSFSQSLKFGNVMALCVDCQGTARPLPNMTGEE